MNHKNYNIKEEIKKDIFLIIIIISLFIGGIVLYQQLPDRMIMHWNIENQPDNYMSKFPGTFLLPFITLLIYAGMVVSPVIDPRKESYRHFKKGYRMIRWGIILFLALLYIIVLSLNLGYNLDIGKIVTMAMGALFIILGNYLPQIRHNYFVGIKFPWTLANKAVWRKTNRLAGKLFFASGMILILSIFFSGITRFVLLISLIVIILTTTTIYSYILYKNQNKK